MRMLPRIIVRDPDRASAFHQEAMGAEEVFQAPDLDDGRPAAMAGLFGDLLGVPHDRHHRDVLPAVGRS
ncbi:hypothetical protein PJ985_04205 [Streptomyces sp. ACA25]|uniref:hypothetical protein n=1 Tax=Streptomyces sp. ACA25 TaxID=3022596 RepID=UPI00230734D5|nr:hypothetical protein [Streptomyces sp. ACA25]MDB1086767.1 hypothetical protein [Streptomyces sp. ACA25]